MQCDRETRRVISIGRVAYPIQASSAVITVAEDDSIRAEEERQLVQLPADDAPEAGADDSADGSLHTIGGTEENTYGVPGPLPQKIPDLIKGPVKQPKDSTMGTLLPGQKIPEPEDLEPKLDPDLIDRAQVERVIKEQNALRG